MMQHTKANVPLHEIIRSKFIDWKEIVAVLKDAIYQSWHIWHKHNVDIICM